MSKFDPDLSTLTNIRLQNRRAKQRLADALAEERTASFKSADLSGFLDESTQSPVKRPSPLRHTYTYRDFSSGPRFRAVDIDSSILEKENLRFLDKTQYDRDIKLNDLKRERLLNGLYSSPELTRSRSKSRQASPMRPSSLGYTQKETKFKDDTKTRFDEIFERSKKKGFRPRSIPDLKPKASYELSPMLSFKPTQTSQESSTSHYIEGLDSRLKDIYEDDFDELVKKYDLKSASDEKHSSKPDQPTERLDTSQVQRLQSKVKQMEAILDDYREQQRLSSSHDEDLLKRNIQLSKEIANLNQFIKFMDSNFQEIYNMWKTDKEEKERLIKRFQEMKLQEVKQTQPTPRRLSPLKFSPLKTRLEPKMEPDDESTEQLLNFNFNH
jgi:hypothetical protein